MQYRDVPRSKEERMKEIDYENYYWQNELVRLRATNADDWEEHYYGMFDTEGRRILQYEIELPPSVEVEKKAAETFIGFHPGSGRLMFAIETLAGEAVGGLNLNGIDEKNGTFGIGIQIYRDHRGKGYGTAAMRILLDYAFFERRLHKLNNSVLEGNIASLTMFKKLGAKEEGLRRETVYMKGRYMDEILVGITKSDFEKVYHEK